VNFYNEFDPKAAAWLREMVRLGELPPGVVDERSIKDLQPHDLDGYTQCHFFAGIGGWSLAARIAGFPADRPLWTGSCPCQPFSVAGKGAGVDDPRHLWPDFLRLIAACRPPLVMGEQVAGAAGYGWLDGVLADLADEGYAGRGVDIPACAVDAPHIRQRLYWIAVAHPGGCGPVGRADEPGGHERDWAAAGRDQGAGRVAERDARGVTLVDASRLGRREGWAEPELWCGRPAAPGADALGVTLGDAECSGLQGLGRDDGGAGGRPLAGRPGSAPDDRHGAGFWSAHDWIACHDGKARRIPEPDVSVLVDGLPLGLDACRSAIRQIAEDEVAAYAARSRTDGREALSLVRGLYDPQEIQRRAGVQEQLCSPEVLFDFLFSIASARNAGPVSSRFAEASAAPEGALVRRVRDHFQLGRPSYRPEPDEQRAGEYPDALWSLSWFLARCAEACARAAGEADAAPFRLLVEGMPSRVVAWRGFGNAIVPPLAAEVIAAYLDVEAGRC
jgi:DNA (cytosine-5)-methyltransferase 1